MVGETDFASLIAKLEAATEGSRELDLAVFRAIGAPLPDSFDPVKLKLTWQDDGTATMPVGDMQVRYTPAAFTTSVDAILAQIERQGWRLYTVDASILGRFSVFLKGPDRLWPATEDAAEILAPGWETGLAKTLPSALCVALLKAISPTTGADQ